MGLPAKFRGEDPTAPASWINYDPALVEALAASGLNDTEIGHVLGATKQQIEQRRSCDPAFAELIAKGRDKGIAKVANKLFEKAIGGDVHAIRYYLDRVAGWDKKVAATGAGGTQNTQININGGAQFVTPKEVSSTEFEKIVAKELKKRKQRQKAEADVVDAEVR
ncbi:MAG: hypothetical protein K2W95_15665 [Candidatus Obscuribacterales bacterium]|nr:hypothetical protein [Candidatus Obscuribacterales bacterium]